MEKKTVSWAWLWRVAFEEAWQLQKQMFQEVMQQTQQDTLLLVEHPHVYTQGRLTQTQHLLFTEEKLRLLQAETFEIDRGGDVTYHGPGQLVGYPILNLAHFKEDLDWYLRALEASIILLLASYGIVAHRVNGRTGVWVGDSPHEQKICAIGIKSSRWCVMHGFALNVNTDLTYFEHIVPCGIDDRPVTSLSHLLGHSVSMQEVMLRYLDAFAQVFEVELRASAVPPTLTSKI
jgi:lipoyl(octanoyl) transferase